MLDENDVVAAVCKYLKHNKYDIIKSCQTTERGIDITAKHQRKKGRLLVEAKGATSACTTSARFGKGFTDNQVWDRVAKGFYTTVCMISKYGPDGDKVALAVPDTPKFHKYLEPLKSIANGLGITIYVVGNDRTVTKL